MIYTTNIFLHISGTHGAEAYAGSAIQIFLLERYAINLSKNKSYNGPTIIFVHALNPYGMKYGRRFNEDNEKEGGLKGGAWKEEGR